MTSFKIIETNNVRATLIDGAYSLKALTPEAKALFRLKKIKSGAPSAALTVSDVINLIDETEIKIAKLAEI